MWVCVCVCALSPSVLYSQWFCSVLWMCWYFGCLKFFGSGSLKVRLRKTECHKTHWVTNRFSCPRGPDSARPLCMFKLSVARPPRFVLDSVSQAIHVQVAKHFLLCRHRLRCGVFLKSPMNDHIFIMYSYLQPLLGKMSKTMCDSCSTAVFLSNQKLSRMYIKIHKYYIIFISY